MATNPSAANEPFNITNGDIFRCQDFWLVIARDFDMETAPAQRSIMADKAPLWERLFREHDLPRILTSSW